MFRPKSITAYNDRLAIVASFNSGATFASGGTTLLGLLQNSQADEVDLQLTDENLIIKTGKSTFKLPYFEEKEFLFEEPKEKWVCKIEINDDLLRALAESMTTASSDLSKPAYLGVCFNLNGKKLTLFSTDGDAITRHTLETCFWDGTGVYLITTDFCSALLKIAQETETTQGTLELNDNWAKAKLNNGFKLYGRMIVNDKKLDYQDVMDSTLKGTQGFANLPLGLKEALARARVLADPENAATLMTVEGGKLKLITETHMGIVRDELRVKGLNDVTASVHASLVQRSLEVCTELSIRENCTAYRLGDTVLQVVANMGT